MEEPHERLTVSWTHRHQSQCNAIVYMLHILQMSGTQGGRDPTEILHKDVRFQTLPYAVTTARHTLGVAAARLHIACSALA